jgi:hypothetical protein
VRARAERFSGSFVVDRMGIGFGKQVFRAVSSFRFDMPTRYGGH